MKNKWPKQQSTSQGIRQLCLAASLTCYVWQMLHQEVVDHGEASVGPLTDRQDVAKGAVQRCHHGDVAPLNVLATATLPGHIPHATPYPVGVEGVML